MQIKYLTALLFLCVLFLGGSVSTFDAKFEQIKEVMSRKEVVGLLGKPLEKRDAAIPDSPIWGPQEYLTSVLRPGAPYEEWQYEKEEVIYLIWFGSADSTPRDKWKVLGKDKYQKGTVF